MEYAKTSRGVVLQHDDREEFYIEQSVELRYRTQCRASAAWKMPTGAVPVVLVQFKNKRVEYYLNTQMLHLEVGDLVTVSTAPGHDVGAVALTGWAAHREYMKSRIEDDKLPLEIFRLSTRNDIDRWMASIAQEHDALVSIRSEAQELRLEMKVFDVEYQGDGNKLTVYYSSEKRVDFRMLVKRLADRFGVRIQMQQQGVRQEPARIGGLGPCGQEMCCARWMRYTPPVLSSAMKMQDLQVLACTGQCGKLKCCLNFELDAYAEARSKMPKLHAPLQFEGYSLYYVKSDIFRQLMWFSTAPKSTMNLVMLTVDEVKAVMAQNAKGEVAPPVEQMRTKKNKTLPTSARVESVIEADSITRFDKQLAKSKKGKRKRKGDSSAAAKGNGGNAPAAQRADSKSPLQEKDSPKRAAPRPMKGAESATDANGQRRDSTGSPKTQGKRRPQRNAAGPRNAPQASVSQNPVANAPTSPAASSAQDNAAGERTQGSRRRSGRRGLQRNASTQKGRGANGPSAEQSDGTNGKN